jgi:transposase
MAYGYIPVDREQQFLLPPDMREWLPEGHLVHFVLAVVARIDTAVLHAAHPNDGVGRRAYDPDMLLALLVYAYCTGVRSSRAIERLCQVDVAYRVVCANRIPDHCTIARFRQDHERIAQAMFIDVLMLCAASGLARVGVVAVDGTKMGADASMRANRSRARIEAEVARMFAAASAADAAEDRLFGDARGDELPVELVDPRSRAARLDAALRELEAAEAARRQDTEAAEAAAARRGEGVRGPVPRGREVQRAEAALDRERQRARDRYKRRQDKIRAGQRRGLAPVPPERSVPVARAEARVAAARDAEQMAEPVEPLRVNVTDPHSALMKTPGGWVQGYNAQAAVNDAGVVLAATVTRDHNDVGQCQPMMAATRANLDAAGVDAPIGVMLFDAGYCSVDNLSAPGPDRLIATAKSHALRRAATEQGFAEGDPLPDADPIRAMEHRLRTEAGARLYAKRQHTVEPVFGHIKAGRGFRGFVRRGLEAVDAEWQLMAATQNILKLHRARIALS